MLSKFYHDSSNSTAAADERVETFRSEGDQSSLYSANAESTSTGPSSGNRGGPTAEHVVAVGSDDSPTVTYNSETLKREGNTLVVWTLIELVLKL